MKDRGYIISIGGVEKITCIEESGAVEIVLSLRKEGYTAEMRRDGGKEFIPIVCSKSNENMVA